MLSISIFTKYDYGVNWLLLFYHNSTGGVYFNSESEVLLTNSNQKYSILNILDEEYRIDYYFEFLLEYPGIQGYNRWKQGVNPLLATDSSTIDLEYVPVNLSWTTRSFGGIAKSNKVQNTYIEGSIRSDIWFYSIGAYYGNTYIDQYCPQKDCIPGPDLTYNIKSVKLWVRTHVSPTTYLAARTNAIPTTNLAKRTTAIPTTFYSEKTNSIPTSYGVMRTRNYNNILSIVLFTIII